MEPAEIASRLIRIPSVSRYESRVAAEIEEMLRPIGVRRQRVGDIGYNLISEYHGSENAPVLILNGHMDTVEPAEGWTKDPYSPEIDGKRLYGLGSADMKGGLAALIWAYKRAVREKLPVNLIFTAVVDEEIYSQGAFELLKYVKGDMAILTEPTDERVMLGARGRYVLDLKFKGRAAHGARPEKGENAIKCASELIRGLDKITLKRDEKMGSGSISPLKIEGGGEFLSVPEICTVVIDRHVVPGEERDSVLEEMKRLIGSLDIPCEVKIEWHPRPTPFLEAYEISPDTAYIWDFIDFYRERYGSFDPIYGRSVGDYNLFAEHMPTLVYGPKGGDWHSADEYVYIDSIERVAGFYYEFIKRIGEKYA